MYSPLSRENWNIFSISAASSPVTVLFNFYLEDETENFILLQQSFTVRVQVT